MPPAHSPAIHLAEAALANNLQQRIAAVRVAHIERHRGDRPAHQGTRGLGQFKQRMAEAGWEEGVAGRRRLPLLLNVVSAALPPLEAPAH